jgi:DNA-binding transcriptional ArsR family regulator
MPRTAGRDAFTAIAEPHRRAIIGVLADGAPHAVGDVVRRVRLRQPAVSKHLGVLRDADLVSVRRQGRRRLYRLNAERLKAVHDWTSTFARLWTHQLDRIKARAEREAVEQFVRRPAKDVPDNGEEER